MKGWLVGGWVVALTFGAANAAQARPHHDGFTGDLGIGLSLMLFPVHSVSVCEGSFGCVESDTKSTQSKWGLAPLSLSLGAFVSPKVALLVRVSGTSYFSDGKQIGHNFYGAIAEVWPIDELYLSGGIGFALYGANPLFNGGSGSSTSGWALDFRVGAALAQGTNHDFTLSLEAIPGFYDGDVVNGVALVGAWKWY